MNNIDKTNIKRNKKKNKKILAVKEVVVSHHTKNLKKVQGYLLEDYDMPIPQRTLERYLAKIERDKKKEIAKKIKIAQVEQKKKESEYESQTHYPYLIKDPSGKEHRITGDNQTISIGWGSLGMITYDTKDKIWRYDHSGKPFDKNDKPKPFHKIRSKNAFEFDDL